MRIDVFTIFPDLVAGYARGALLGRALAAGLLELRVHDLRMFTNDRHGSVDDAPFGGGPGMVMAPGPIFSAVEVAQPPRPLYLLGPAGRRLDQALIHELAGTDEGFSLLCGRYEGVDQRVADHLVDGEISIGDYVLAGGELAALVVVEAVARLVPGVLGNQDSAVDESFAEGLVEYPQYTRPAEFRGWEVPEVLRSGNHDRVARWRRAHSLGRTAVGRPDLIARRGGLSAAEARLCAEHGYPGMDPGRTQGPTEEHPRDDPPNVDSPSNASERS